jgi:cytochrome P450
MMNTPQLPRLLTSDLSALNAILSRTDTFQKPPQAQRFLGAILGPGVLVAEGSAHRAQRRILNPAFGPAQLRALTGIFLDKANEVRPLFLASSQYAKPAS